MTGPRAGESEVFVDNLPGFPDNVSTGTDGLIWVAMGSPRDRRRRPAGAAAAPRCARRSGPCRPGCSRARRHTVWVYALSPDGEVVHDLQAPGDRFGFVTGVREHHGTVHMGSLTGDTVGLFDLP